MKIGKSESTGRYYDMDTGQEISGAAVETGPFQSALIGAGRTVNNVLENLGIRENDPNADQAMADLRSVNPKSTFAGEAGASMLPIVKAGRVLSGLQAAGQSYLTGDSQSSAVNRVALGAAGQVGGDMVGRVIDRASRLRGTNRAAQTGPAQQFKDTGGVLTPAQATQNPSLQVMEAKLARRPGSAGVIDDMYQANQVNTNRLAMEAMGVPAAGRKALTDDILVEAEESIGRTFQRVAADVPSVNVGKELSDQIRDIAGTTRQAKRVWQKQTGLDIEAEELMLSGPALMRVRSFASKRSKSSNLNVRDDAIDLMEQIDDIVEGNSAAGDLYAKARDQWRTLKSLDRAGSISSSGNINPTSAYGRLRGWKDAQGASKTLRDNVQAASALQLPFGNSGTAQGSGSLVGATVGAPFNWLGAQAYKRFPESILELGNGPASALGVGTVTKGLLSPGGENDGIMNMP